MNVGADQLDDVTRLDAEGRTDGGAGNAVVVPDDQHLWQTCDMENQLWLRRRISRTERKREDQ